MRAENNLLSLYYIHILLQEIILNSGFFASQGAEAKVYVPASVSCSGKERTLSVPDIIRGMNFAHTRFYGAQPIPLFDFCASILTNPLQAEFFFAQILPIQIYEPLSQTKSLRNSAYGYLN